MAFGELMGLFLKLQHEVDTELIGYFSKFVDRAVASGDPKAFLKGVLKAVVEAPEPQEKNGRTVIQVVEVPILPAKGKRR